MFASSGDDVRAGFKVPVSRYLVTRSKDAQSLSRETNPERDKARQTLSCLGSNLCRA
jgi:hypothetical protein